MFSRWIRRSSFITIVDPPPDGFVKVRMNDLVDVPADELIRLFGAEQSHAAGIDKNNPVFAMNENRVGQCVYEGSEVFVRVSGWTRLRG